MMNTLAPGFPENVTIAKAQAKRLTAALQPSLRLKHGQALEAVAKLHGAESWGHMNALLSGSKPPSPRAPMQPSTQIPSPAIVAANKPSSVGPARLVGPHPHRLSPGALMGLYEALRASKGTAPTASTHAMTAKLLKDRLVRSVYLEGWLSTLDTSLGSLIYHMSAETVVELSGASATFRYAHPSTDEFMPGRLALRPASFAAVLIWLERLGLDTHPEAFYEPFLRDLRKLSDFEPDELTCLLHKREGHTFRSEETFHSGLEVKVAEVEEWTGPFGHTFRAVVSKVRPGPIESLHIKR